MGMEGVFIVLFELWVFNIEACGYSGPRFWRFKHSAGLKKQELISMFAYLFAFISSRVCPLLTATAS